MEIPTSFKPGRNLEEKTQRLVKGIKKKEEDIPEEIKNLGDITKYFANTTIPIFGYDDKKRIHKKEAPLKEVLKKKIFQGRVYLLDTNPIKYKGLYFTREENNNSEELSLDLTIDLDVTSQKTGYKISDKAIKHVKEMVKNTQDQTWALAGICNTADFNLYTYDCTKVNIKTPKEIQWVFETFKDFNPRIHGGTLRDLYLGIKITGDIDVQLSSPDGWWQERKLRKFIESVMDETKLVSKGWKEDSYHSSGKYHPARYNANKFGMTYDITGGVFQRYLSTEQIIMENPGELTIYNLAKNDLDNKQFRMIESINVPERVFTKIEKLEGMGLKFFPENPRDLSNTMIPFNKKVDTRKYEHDSY